MGQTLLHTVQIYCFFLDFFLVSFSRKNALYGRIINDRASMMALGELCWVGGILKTTIHTGHVHFGVVGSDKNVISAIPKEVQNVAKIIIFALFGVFFFHFFQDCNMIIMWTKIALTMNEIISTQKIFPFTICFILYYYAWL